MLKIACCAVETGENIPRLELAAAALLSKLVETMSNKMEQDFDAMHL